MDWPKILVEYHQQTLKRMDKMDERQEQTLTLALDAYKRSKANESLLKEMREALRAHDENTTALRESVSGVVGVLTWAQTTGKVLKWAGGIAASVGAIVAGYQLFF